MNNRSIAAKSWMQAIALTRQAAGRTFSALLDDLVKDHGYDTALIDAKEILNYRTLYDRTNQIARFAQMHGLSSGDVICLLMSNQADYVAIWLGLNRLGCTVALLNTNLRGDALIHSIHVANAKVLIAADDSEINLVNLPVKQIWNWPLIRLEIEQISALPLNECFPTPDDLALLIYTSGTTGFPKATRITHKRILEWSYWFAGMMDIQPQDRMYNCLPMYHSVGGIVAVGSLLVSGASVYIRERFSASQFWNDIYDYQCTIFQYIGELCRYLTLSPKHPRERSHKLRLACGNGMQGDVWLELQKRFVIPRVLEFYAATEGNLSLYNCEGKVGAIGRVPPFLAQHFPVALIRVDIETGRPILNEHGFCIRCEVDEPGEAISNMANRRFDGYTDAAASAKKLLHDVFVEGDEWFRSGDLMRQDAAGYFYFVDRLGDTFRWKGENVSTAEVASVIRIVPGVIDVAVYGVVIPGNEGRAGMAAISTDDRFDFVALSEHLRQNLPEYAHPLFVRLCQSLNITGTFKLSKIDLIRESYTGTTDPIWSRNHDGSYTPVSS
jgi:fatty-acyl-CoA synthase